MVSLRVKMVRLIQVMLLVPNLILSPECGPDTDPRCGLQRCRYITLDFISVPGGLCFLSSPNLNSSIEINLERWLNSCDVVTPGGPAGKFPFLPPPY